MILSPDQLRASAEHYLAVVGPALDRAERVGPQERDLRYCEVRYARTLLATAERFLDAAAAADSAAAAAAAAEACADDLAGVDPLAPAPDPLRLAREYPGTGVELGEFADLS